MGATKRANGGILEKRGRLTRGRSLAVGALAVVGLVLAALLVGGVIADGLSFDRTSGGYEPPYTGYTGEPIDWEAAHTSPRKASSRTATCSTCTSTARRAW